MKKTEENCIRGCANVEMINRSIQELSELSDKIKNVATILGLTGNETRLKILLLIKKEKKVCVCDLSDILEISVSAISQQLKKLKDGHILKSEKEGQTIYYHIHPSSEEILEHIFEIFNHKLIKKVA
jgi:ArsR family transcriptional regulator, lead/cadmium/zinc/bismuth-responsive transcriptional repressor